MYIKLNDENEEEVIEKTVLALKQGKLIILPTDTVYGISSDAMNKEAVRKIYKLKNRDFSKPCNILACNIEMVENVTKNISKKEKEMLEKYPVTIILKKNDVILDIVTAGKNTIGVRIPNNSFLLKVIERFGKPIVSTSLNLSGEKEKTNLDNLQEEFKNNIDLIIDAGEAKEKNASTIIQIENEKIKVLRQGTVKI